MEVKKISTKHPIRPAWFEDFYEKDYKPFQNLVIQKFDEISKLLSNLVEYNNLKTHE